MVCGLLTARETMRTRLIRAAGKLVKILQELVMGIGHRTGRKVEQVKERQRCKTVDVHVRIDLSVGIERGPRLHCA